MTINNNIIFHKCEHIITDQVLLLMMAALIMIESSSQISLVDDLVFDLSRFLFFLNIRQDSFVIPSVQDSCLKKQILSFWQDSCRQNLGWWGKKCLARQDSCVLVFLSDSFFLNLLSWFFFLDFLARLFFVWKFLPDPFFLIFLRDFFFFSWISKKTINDENNLFI